MANTIEALTWLSRCYLVVILLLSCCYLVVILLVSCLASCIFAVQSWATLGHVNAASSVHQHCQSGLWQCSFVGRGRSGAFDCLGHQQFWLLGAGRPCSKRGGATVADARATVGGRRRSGTTTGFRRGRASGRERPTAGFPPHQPPPPFFPRCSVQHQDDRGRWVFNSSNVQVLSITVPLCGAVCPSQVLLDILTGFVFLPATFFFVPRWFPFRRLAEQWFVVYMGLGSFWATGTCCFLMHMLVGTCWLAHVGLHMLSLSCQKVKMYMDHSRSHLFCSLFFKCQ